LHTKNLQIRYKQDDKPVIGFIVSKKFGGAVKRNQLKRRCRAIFTDLRHAGLNQTLIIKPRKHHISYKDLQDSFQKFADEVFS